MAKNAERSAPPPTPPTEPAPERPRKKRRWLRWLVWGSVCVVIALSVGLWGVWKYRLDLARSILRASVPGWEAEITAFDADGRTLVFRDLALLEPGTHREIAHMDRITLLPSWRTLAEGSLGSVHIEGFRIDASWEELTRVLSTWSTPAEALQEVETNPDASSWHLNQLVLKNGRFDIHGSVDRPSLSGDLHLTLDDLEFDSVTGPELGMLSLDLRNVGVNQNQAFKTLGEELRLQASFERSSGLLSIRELQVREWTVTLEPTALLLSEPGSEPPSLPDWFTGISVSSLEVEDLSISAPSGIPGYPALRDWSCEGQIDHHSSNILWTVSKGLESGGQHQVSLISPTFSHLPTRETLLEAGRIDAEAHHSPTESSWKIRQVILETPTVTYTPAVDLLLEPLAQGAGEEPQDQHRTAEEIELEQVQIHQARVEVEPGVALPIHGRFRLDAELDQLYIGSSIRSSRSQKLTFHQIQAATRRELGVDQVEIERLHLQAIPDALIDDGEIEAIEIQSPRLNLDLTQLEAPPEKESPLPDAPDQEDSPTWMQRIHPVRLLIDDGQLSVRGRLQHEFEVRSSFAVAPDQNRHRLTLENTLLRAPTLASRPLATLGKVSLLADLKHLNQRRTLDSLRVTDGRITVDQSLLSLVTPPASPDSPEAPPQPLNPTAWRVGTLDVEAVRVRLDEVAPGLPPIDFELRLHAEDTPLDAAALVENADAQKVELRGLKISAPYGSLSPVARLNTVFIHFTLAGLLRQEIDKIDVISPTLYVGQPLFWYVDYYRKYAAGEIDSYREVPGLALAAADSDSALAAAAAGSPPPRSEDSQQTPEWSVLELSVHGGKLVLAPKGVPLSGFHQPFPFSFSTRLDSGQLNAELDIPEDTYTFSNLKLELRGMHGKVLFNLPIQTIDNNLTETFWIEQIRWKQLHAEEAHLSVTYDENGIYGQFGAEAYEGYVDGAFNFYLDDVFSWDGWVAASSVRSTEITEKLFPEYFLLDGVVTSKVVANGNAHELYQAQLEFTNEGAGRFSIAGLNSMLADLPPATEAPLSDQLMRIGIETLRDFDYDTVEGEATLYGREGTASLIFTGPLGSRNIAVTVYDHRSPEPPAPDSLP